MKFEVDNRYFYSALTIYSLPIAFLLPRLDVNEGEGRGGFWIYGYLLGEIAKS